jgi:hypothetical protein
MSNLSIRGIAQSFGELPSPILTDTEAEYFNPEYSIKVAGIETLFLICPGYEHNPDEKRFNTTCCFVQSHADVIYIDNHGQSNIGQIEPWMDDNVYGGDTCKANSKKFSVLDHIHAFSDFLYNDCNHYINFWQNNLVAMDCNFLFLFSCSQMRGAPEGEQCPRDQWHEIIDNNGLIPSPFIEAVAGYNQILHGYRGTVYHEDYDESTFYEEHCGVYSSVLLDLFADRLLSWDAYNEKEYYDNNIYIYAFMQANLDIANVIGPDGKFRNRNHEQPGQGRAINENHCWYIKADPDSPIKEHPDIDDTGQPILYEVHKSEDWRKPF